MVFYLELWKGSFKQKACSAHWNKVFLLQCSSLIMEVTKRKREHVILDTASLKPVGLKNCVWSLFLVLCTSHHACVITRQGRAAFFWTC